MNKWHPLILFLFFATFCSCEKKSPCDDLVNGVYQFPEVPSNHDMSIKEVNEFVNLPEDIIECITTDGLIETCRDYPYISLIMAGSCPQSGYELVKGQFRGLQELERRPNRGQKLLASYRLIDPIGYNENWTPMDIARYNFDTDFFELIFGQYCHLETLSEKEVIILMEKSLLNYNRKKSDPENQSIMDLGFTATLMARMMFQYNYMPFTEEYNTNLNIYELVEFAYCRSLATAELTASFAEQFLIFLKNEQS